MVGHQTDPVTSLEGGEEETLLVFREVLLLEVLLVEGQDAVLAETEVQEDLQLFGERAGPGELAGLDEKRNGVELGAGVAGQLRVQRLQRTEGLDDLSEEYNDLRDGVALQHWVVAWEVLEQANGLGVEEGTKSGGLLHGRRG